MARLHARAAFPKTLGRAPARLYDDDLALYGARYYYRLWEMPIFGAMGVAAGLLGAGFIRAHVAIAALRARYVPPRLPWRRLAEVAHHAADPQNCADELSRAALLCGCHANAVQAPARTGTGMRLGPPCARVPPTPPKLRCVRVDDAALL